MGARAKKRALEPLDSEAVTGALLVCEEEVVPMSSSVYLSLDTGYTGAADFSIGNMVCQN